MEDLIFHMFFVVPLTRCITSSERPWNKKNPRLGTILAVVALFLIGVFQSRRDGENYYEVLNVRPNSPPRVVSAAYRKLAVQYHPDKNQHPDAKEMFAKIREAYGVLMNEKRRSSYLRFGDYSKEGDVDEEQFYDVLFLAFFQFLVPFLLAFLYTYKSDAAPSREIFTCYVATSFALELLLRFDDRATHYLTFLPVVGDWLPFEKVQLLHSWMPVVLNGLLLLGSDLASNEDETFDDITRNAVDWRLDTLVYMERYLCAAETILKASKTLDTRRRWARIVSPEEKKKKNEKGKQEEERAIVTTSIVRSASHVSFDADTADVVPADGNNTTDSSSSSRSSRTSSSSKSTSSTSSTSSSNTNKKKVEYKILEGKEEQEAIRLFHQFQEEEMQRTQTADITQQQSPTEGKSSQETDTSSGSSSDSSSVSVSNSASDSSSAIDSSSGGSGDSSSSSSGTSSSSGSGYSSSYTETSGGMSLRRRRSRHEIISCASLEHQGSSKLPPLPLTVDAAAAAGGEAGNKGSSDTAAGSDKTVEQAARRRMRERGYIEVLQYVKPWRLDPNSPPSSEQPDLWADVMEKEVRAWPDGLTEEGIATRADCTERGWDKQQDKIVALMQEADEEEEKLGHGISLGSIIFFGSLLLRWYTGSG